MLASVSVGLSTSIMTNAPTMLSSPDMSCVVDCEIVLLTLSISLDNRLMTSPWRRLSKYASGSFCSFRYSVRRKRRTIRCAIPAIARP
ncbi:hypothetical protein D3C84_950750 [compost metagenome]